jgi:segregation and condensation protein B
MTKNSDKKRRSKSSQSTESTEDSTLVIHEREDVEDPFGELFTGDIRSSKSGSRKKSTPVDPCELIEEGDELTASQQKEVAPRRATVEEVELSDFQDSTFMELELLATERHAPSHDDEKEPLFQLQDEDKDAPLLELEPELLLRDDQADQSFDEIPSSEMPHQKEDASALPSDDEMTEVRLADGDKLILNEELSPQDIIKDNQEIAAGIEAGGGGDQLALREELSLESQVEAIVFASPKPIKAIEIHEILNQLNAEISLPQVEAALKLLIKMYSERAGGFKLENIRSEGYQFRTVECAAPLMERLFATRPRPLSRAAFETLSIIAYRQPVTRAEVEYIRGVDAGSIIKNLMDRNLIQCVGRKDEAGRPMLFGTTFEFLRVFKLQTLNDLPSLASFQPQLEVMKQANEALDPQTEVDIEPYVGGLKGDEQEVSAPLLFQEDEESEALKGQRVRGAEAGRRDDLMTDWSASDEIHMDQPSVDFKVTQEIDFEK